MNKPRLLSRILASIILVFYPFSYAFATVITIDVSGVLADSSLTFPSNLINGDANAFSFSYDSSAPDVDPDPDVYIAYGGNEWSTQWGPYSASGVGNSLTYFNSAGLLTFTGYSELASEGIGILGSTIAADFSDGGPNNDGAIFGSVFLELILDNPTIDPNLVVDALLNGAFTARSLVLIGRTLDYPANGDVAFRYESEITDVKITSVPIPAALWLFGSGLLGLVGVARTKNDTMG